MIGTRRQCLAALAQLICTRRVKVRSVQLPTMTEKVSGSGAGAQDSAKARSDSFEWKALGLSPVNGGSGVSGV